MREEFERTELKRKKSRVKEIDSEVAQLQASFSAVSNRIAYLRELQAEILDELPLHVLVERPLGDLAPFRERTEEDPEASGAHSFWYKTQPPDPDWKPTYGDVEQESGKLNSEN